MARRGCLFGLFLLALPLVVGCSQEFPYGEVEGVATLDGKPLTHAEVVFMPDPEKGTRGRRSVALTDKNGHYRIASDLGREGAPVGFHRVIINDMLVPKLGMIPVAVTPEEAGPTRGPIGLKAPTTPANPDQKKSRFPEAYADAIRTPFRGIEVKAGSQTIDLKLKR
jgi:hypothetical protein